MRDTTDLSNETDVQMLVKAIFTSVREGDRGKHVRSAMEETARSARDAQASTFQSVFINASAKAMEKGAFGDSSCFALSRLVAIVASTGKVEDDTTAKALETLARLRARGRRVFSAKALRAFANDVGCDALLDKYLELVKGGANTVLCALVGEMYAAAREFSKRDIGETRRTLLQLYADVVLNGDAKVVAAGVTAEAFTAVLSDITEDEMKDVLLPKMVRQLRRSPEAVLPIILNTLEGVKVDLSSSCAELGELLIPLAKHADAARRDVSRRIIDTLAANSADASLVKEHIFARCAAEFDAGKRPKEWTARVGLYDIIGSCSRISSRKDREALSANAIAILATEMAVDKQLDAKAAGLRALTTWLQHIAACPASVVALIKESSKDTKERGSTLQAIAQALRSNSALASGLSETIAVLVPITVAGAAKSAQRAEGLSALYLTVRAAADDAAVLDAATKGKLWESLSAYFDVAAVTRFDDSDAQTLAATSQCLLSAHSSQLIKLKLVDVVIQTIALLSLHSNAQCRAAAREAIRGAISQGQAPTKMIQGLQHWLEQAAAGTFPAVGAEADETFPSRYAGASLLAYCEFDEDEQCVKLSSDLVGDMLLLAHNPLVAAADGRRSGAWSALIARLGEDIGDATNGEAVCETMAGERGLASPSSNIRVAARRAIVALGRLSSNDVSNILLPKALGMIDIRAHDEISDKDILIYNTAPGTLSTDPKDKPAAAQKEDKQESSTVVSLRPSQLAAGAKKSTKAPPKTADPREAARRAQLAEEADIRARVRSVVDSLVEGLDVLTCVLEGLGHRTREKVCDIAYRKVFPLLRSKIIPQTVVLRTVETLLYCAAARGAAMILSFPQERRTEALAIRLGAMSLDGSPKPVEFDLNGKPIPVDMHVVNFETRMLSEALELAKGALEDNDPDPLPAPVFGMIFPIISHALLLPEAPKSLRIEALNLLAAHAGDDEDGVPILPSAGAAVRVLLNTLSNATPDLVNLAKPILSDVSRYLQTSDDVLALVNGVESEFRAVRGASLSGLLSAPLDFSSMDDCVAAEAIAKLFIARFDSDDGNKALAEEVWVLCGLSDTVPPPADILEFLTHESAATRTSAIDAFSASVAHQENGMSTSLPKLFAAFNTCERSYARESMIKGLGACTPSLSARDLPLVSTFLTKVLTDVDGAVRAAAVETGRTMIDAHGAEHTQQLLAVYEAYFDRGGSRSDLSEEAEDHVRQGVVVFLGALAVHLDKDDEKVRAILTRLLEVLSTPSEAVQRSVADCLPPLMKKLNEDEQRALVDALLQQLTSSESYADRRGAAFGLAGAVKGIGMSSLKGMNIMDTLKVAIEDKKNPASREGAVMAFELFCTRLGRLFEPYVVNVLPMLLVCFGDVTAPVRDATQAAARAIMANLSAQGVKLVLPALLCGVDDDKWRTKQGSVQLLGAMSNCAPKQLGACLPQIVPRLSETLIDTHPKVVEAATQALKAIGDVIRNPEILALSKYLLGAISLPAERTQACLDVLLETTFVNVVDAPSLALIVPVLVRGMRERKAEMKKKAAKIAGNMSALVADPKDMAPYIPMIVPELKKALIDPIPEVRGVAAQALAGLIKGMGEEYFEDLLPWMMRAMQSDGPSVERSGAAQGLSECLAVLSSDHFDALFPEILAGCANASSAVREGHLTLLRFLPISLGDMFEAHLADALACVLEGLADEDEPVRDAALSAGRVFVEEFSHSGSSLDLILPAIEDGIVADSWRIRQSSVELLGSMLFRIIGSSGKVRVEGGDDEEGISTEAQGQMLSSTLGQSRHFNLLAAVYILRSDATLVVRNAAVHIWKTVVANTPKTLRLILPMLMSRVIATMSGCSEERQQTASRCLGDVVRKLGERVLSSVLPILRDGLSSEVAEHREGVALGLAEVLSAATQGQIAAHYDVIIPTVRDALCDDDKSVRDAAGKAFDMLFQHAGGDAAARIVPELLEQLDANPLALEGLKQVLKAQPKILATVLPNLAKPPLTISGARTLGALAEVAGSALPPHLPLLMPPLMDAMADADEESRVAASSAASAVIVSVPETSSHLLLNEIKQGMAHERAGCRAAAAKLAGEYAKNAPGFDDEHETEVLIKRLFELFTDDDEDVLLAAWTAMGDVTSTISRQELPDYVECVAKSLTMARDRVRRKDKLAREYIVPALRLPKGLAPIVQIFLQGVLSAESSEQRESAARGLTLAVSSTDSAALKAHVIAITGPLIRVVGDKHPSAVKSAILESLAALINKGGVALKPFVPQLQTTFVKCLSDAHMSVRVSAASALGLLMTLQTRVDALASDLISQCESDDVEPGVRESTFRAIAGVFAHGGAHISAPNVTRAIDATLRALASYSEGERTSASLALSRAFARAPADERASVVDALNAPSGCEHRQGTAEALCQISRANAALVMDEHASATLNALVRAAADDQSASKCAAARGLGALAGVSARELGASSPVLPKLLPVLTKLLRDATIDVRFAATRAIRVIIRSAGRSELSPFYDVFMPVLAECAVADKSGDVRKQAERAVYRVFNLQDGLEEALEHLRSGGTANAARGRLTDIALRQLAALPTQSDDEADTSVEADLMVSK